MDDSEKTKRIKYLEDTLESCLEAILKPDNGVDDIIWHTNHETLAEHIAHAINKPIDFEEVYERVKGKKIEMKCPLTVDFEVVELRKRIIDVENIDFSALKKPVGLFTACSGKDTRIAHNRAVDTCEKTVREALDRG